MLLQPPLLTTDVKTSEAEFLGHKIRSGIITTKKPLRWPYNERVSMNGRYGAPQVLKKMVMTKKAIIMSVYCQFGNAKSGFSTSIIASIIVVHTNTELATLAIQPRLLIQPTA